MSFYSLRLHAFVLCCLPVFYAPAQNLVPNGDFETHETCPTESAQYKLLSAWESVSEATPDLFCDCAKEASLVNTAKNFAGSQAPRSGTCYAGLLAWHSDEYYEYLQVKLNQPLVGGKKYLLTFYYTISDYSDKKVAQLGAQFKAEKNQVTGTPRLTDAALNDSIVNNLRLWKPFQLVYTAKGQEQYLTIGCFTEGTDRQYSDRVPDGYGPSPGDHFAYYYIDDVSLEPYNGQALVKEPVNAKGKSKTPPLGHTPVFKPAVVYFDTDRSSLRTADLPALEKLAVWLKQNPKAQVTLNGHTDDSGTDERNSPLGLERAQAVKKFLVQKGIPGQRITCSGHGSKNPAKPNDTEANKQQNRRVEITIVSK